MKPQKLFFLTFLIFSLSAYSQNAAPKGYRKGNIVLQNGTILSGYVKDNAANDASFTFIADSTTKKIKYSSSEITSVDIEGTKFICFKHDFFKVLSSGELSVLQKASNISSKPQYNGTQVFFLSGTEGRLGDYFVCNTSKDQLLLINKKNKDAILSLFTTDAASLEIAKQNAADSEVIKNAVALYNSHLAAK
jgi:hypothetical protein